jgi:hypothetical protein
MGCDAGRICEARRSGTGITGLNLIGYVSDGVQMRTDFVNITPGVGAWTNLTAWAAGAVMGFVCFDTTNQLWGLRIDGSAENIKQYGRYGVLPVKLLSSIAEGYIDSGAALYDIGYAEPAPVGWANISKVNGIASSSMAKTNGIAVASISKVNGVAV